MVEIISLDESNKLYIPEITKLFDEEISKLAGHYPKEVIEGRLVKYTKGYFEQISDSKGLSIFPIQQCYASRAVHMAISDKTLEGALLSTRYSDGDWSIAEILWVLARTKGQGIGTNLIERYVQELIEKDKPNLVGLSVSKTNIRAKNLYERLGFEYFKERPDASYMEIYTKRL